MGGGWNGDVPPENGPRTGPIMVWKAPAPDGKEIRVVSFSNYLTTIGLAVSILAFVYGKQAGTDELADKLLRQVDEKQKVAQQLADQQHALRDARIATLEAAVTAIRTWQENHIDRHHMGGRR